MATATGQIYIISAPSGAGKTSLLKKLIQENTNIKASISYTTRPKRNHEEHGKSYFFATPDEWDEMHASGKFLESATIYGHKYGTPNDWVTLQLQQGIDIILEIDVQGAQQVSQKIPSACSIFILPPSLTELKNRLELRQSDSPESIKTRLASAQHEIQAVNIFNYIVINDNFTDALTTLKSIIISNRHKKERFILPNWVDNLIKQ